jgi:hypothetical protein
MTSQKAVTFIAIAVKTTNFVQLEPYLKWLYRCTINSTWYISLPHHTYVGYLEVYIYAAVHSYKTKDCLTPAFLWLVLFCTLGGREMI